MTQNASVEAVAARTHRMERNGLMLKARRGYSDDGRGEGTCFGKGQRLKLGIVEGGGRPREPAVEKAPWGNKTVERKGAVSNVGCNPGWTPPNTWFAYNSAVHINCQCNVRDGRRTRNRRG